jgi:hypothetical protein
MTADRFVNGDTTARALTNYGVVTVTGALVNQGGSTLENAGTMTAGVLQVTTGIVTNRGTIVAGAVTNSGSIFVSGGSLIVSGTITNTASGNLNVVNGIVRGGSLYGGIFLDPSTGYFGNVVFDNDHYAIVDAGSAIHVSGNMDNQLTNRVFEGMTQAPTWYNFQGQFVFTNAASGGVAATQQVEVASFRTEEAAMSATNYFIGTFMVGDPANGNKSYVQLVDNRVNAPADAVPSSSEILAASNLFVYTGSTLDWNNRSGFAYNLSNAGTMLWTNAGNPAAAVMRLDVVNSFTNQGMMQIGNGTTLQLSNAFLNGPTAYIGLFNGGVLTNFATGGVLTNQGTIYGDGLVNPALSNGVGSVVEAIGGNLLLNGGIVDTVNYGTLGTTNNGTLSVNNALLTNASSGRIGLASGTFTMVGAGSNVVNHSVIGGYGTVAAIIGNEADGSIVATGGVLTLSAGFTNDVAGTPVNAGLLAAFGASSELAVNQAFTNVGSIQLNNATAVFTAPAVTNSGTIFGKGTFNAILDNVGTVSNSTGGALNFSLRVNNQAGGSIRAYDGSTIAFNNAVTNSGAISAQNGSQLRFNQGLTLAGNGSLALNPSTAIITGTLLLGNGGIITMANSNCVLVMRGDYVNGSTDTNNFNTRYGTMVFGGTTPLTGGSQWTNTFEVASTNKGAVQAAFVSNMALGRLSITNHIEFVNNINNGGGLGTNEALYVDVLHLFNGATLKLSQLTIYVGQQFIYEDGNGTKTYMGLGTVIDQSFAANENLVNLFLDNGGQIVFVPEPSTGLLVGLGLAGLAGWRRRRTAARR